MVETPIRPLEMGGIFQGQGIPLVPVICTTCAHIVWFNAIQDGIIRQRNATSFCTPVAGFVVTESEPCRFRYRAIPLIDRSGEHEEAEHGHD